MLLIVELVDLPFSKTDGILFSVAYAWRKAVKLAKEGGNRYGSSDLLRQAPQT